ncbi:MAG: HAD-IC family P-type ATPase, partial [Candidatus Promineifilaceae bacterium]|nr:HAD-IC family P-type ATPase [Candidatus Promineifilaceae bacterium]
MSEEQKEQSVELPIRGMDCAACARHVQYALEDVPRVTGADVFLSTEKAVVRLDAGGADRDALHRAVADAGYQVDDQVVSEDVEEASPAASLADSARPILVFFGVMFAVVLVVVVIGEWLGVLEAVTDRVPWPLMLAAILFGGAPIFRNVIRAALRKQVTSHTLMTVGMLAAIAVGEWAAAAVVVFFMRVGDYTERFTAERARRALKDLAALAPQTARVVRDGVEQEVAIEKVEAGDTVVVRPGEKIPVDGAVVEGQATVDQAAITGESMPVEVGPGAEVFAATIAQLGSLRVRAERVGAESTFGRVIKMVEEAEAHRADVQRVADSFSTYYLPVVAGVAALTYLFS